MKKIAKKLMAILLILTMLIPTIPVKAEAEEVVVNLSKRAACVRVAPNDKVMKDLMVYLGSVDGTDDITVKSSNRKVAVVKKFAHSNGAVINVYGKRNGTAIITVTVNKKPYKCRVTVCDYKNPVSSIKIRNYKFSQNRFDKTVHNKSLRYAKLAGKRARIRVNVKKGWSVSEISYIRKTFDENQDQIQLVRNGGVLRPDGGAGSMIQVICYHKKTGAYETIDFTLV